MGDAPTSRAAAAIEAEDISAPVSEAGTRTERAGVAPPGALRGRVVVPEDFDEPLEEFASYRGDPS